MSLQNRPFRVNYRIIKAAQSSNPQCRWMKKTYGGLSKNKWNAEKWNELREDYPKINWQCRWVDREPAWNTENWMQWFRMQKMRFAMITKLEVNKLIVRTQHVHTFLFDCYIHNNMITAWKHEIVFAYIDIYNTENIHFGNGSRGCNRCSLVRVDFYFWPCYVPYYTVRGFI